MMTFTSLADELAGADDGEGQSGLWQDDDLDLFDYEEPERPDETHQRVEAGPYGQEKQDEPAAKDVGPVPEVDHNHATPRKGHTGAPKFTAMQDSTASVVGSTASSYRTAPTSPEGVLFTGPAVQHSSPIARKLWSASSPRPSPLGSNYVDPVENDDLDRREDHEEASFPRSPSPSHGYSPETLRTPETFVEPAKDPLVELQDCLGASQRLTQALRELDRAHGSRQIEAGLDRLTRMIHTAEKERDDDLRQIQLLRDGFAQIKWGHGLHLSPLLPSGLADEHLVANASVWSEQGADHRVDDITSSTAESETDDSSWPPSSWSGRGSDFTGPDIDTCDMDEIPRNMELADLQREAHDLHAALVQDREEPLILGLRALDESLSIALSHSTHAARQLRGIKAAVSSAREAEEDERTAREGVEAWERARMQRGLRGDDAGTEVRLRQLCQGWEASVDAWGARMQEIRDSAAGVGPPLKHLDKQYARTVPVL